MYVLVDLGYLMFYRMHATLAYLSHRKDPNPSEAATTELFEQHLVAQLDKLKKKATKLFGKVAPTFLFCQDERQSDIWRMRHYKEYKSNRPQGDDMIKLVHGVMMRVIKQYGTVYHGAGLEADDVAYLLVKKIRREKGAHVPILILTSDRDYLQMKDDHITIMDGAGKEMKGSEHGAEVDLWTKILMGDVSDHIPPVAKGVGKKTALSLALDPVKRNEFIQKKRCQAQVELNQKLIDFTKLPLFLVDAFNACAVLP